jgi:hypothetical protein
MDIRENATALRVVYCIDVSTNVVDRKTLYWRENLEGIFNVDHPIYGQNKFLRVTRELWPS